MRQRVISFSLIMALMGLVGLFVMGGFSGAFVKDVYAQEDDSTVLGPCLLGLVRDTGTGTCVMPSVELTISANVLNYNLYNEAVAAGWQSGQSVTLTIVSGVTVGSSSTGQPAFTTGGFSGGQNITIINNGTIQGHGGTGGRGSHSEGQWSGNAMVSPTAGGTAMQLTAAVSFDNTYGHIWSGGGGGGGGCRRCVYHAACSGGGGAGSVAGAGGAATGERVYGRAGAAGSLTAGGAGGQGCCNGTGGNGGGPGLRGSNGQHSGCGNTKWQGAVAGSAIIGSSNLNFINSGDVRGAQR